MRNIIITGGELFNKGAQAMTFVTVDECKKRFPDHEIYVLSEMDLRRPAAEKEMYSFAFTGWYPVRFAHCQSNPLLRALCLVRNNKELKECESLYRNCDLMIDVSGYGLGSNWDSNQLSNYVNHLEFAKAFGIPYYLMPQSFGPFDFSGEKKIITEKLPELLQSVKQICAREEAGYKALLEYCPLSNIQVLPDIVLNNRGINSANIYRHIPKQELPDIKENSIALVPNTNIVTALGKEGTRKLYQSMISFLLWSGKNVYIIRHSSTDQELCDDIMTSIGNCEQVVYLDRDFSCLEYNELVREFRFVIASRFHAIVHAYKNSIPCIAIGWALKYGNLLEEFEQGRYAFDVYTNLDIDLIEEAIRYLDSHLEEESKKIYAHLTKIQEKNVFDIIH